jgi:TetR/AcrR family transcriptional regulator
LIDFTIDHFLNHPAFRALTTYENLLGGQTVAKSQTIAALSSPLIETIRGVLDRGQTEGVFHRSVDPLQLYVSIVALSSHHLNNVHTLSATFRTDLSAPKWRAERAEHVRTMLLAYLTGGAG